MKVVVGSQNPVKIEAVRQAFCAVWPQKNWEVTGVDLTSGVSDQPMSDLESIKGATNRANNAIKKSKVDYSVGLEGGLQQIGSVWFDCGWIVIIDKKGYIGIGSTIRMNASSKMIKMIKAGIELGAVNDILFNKINSKQAEGHFGVMTNNVITRTAGYRDGVIAALARFIQPQVFKD